MVSLTNGGVSCENPNKRPLPIGNVPKYKPRKVSAVRHFPPNCGPNAVKHSEMAEAAEANEIKNSVMANITEVGGVKDSEMSVMKPEAVSNSELVNVEVSIGVKIPEIEVEGCENTIVNNLVEMEMSKSADMMVGEVLTTATDDLSNLVEEHMKDTRTSFRREDKYSRRKVSAVRDFPPLCGRNAPQPTQEETQMVVGRNDCMDTVEKVEVETNATQTLGNLDGEALMEVPLMSETDCLERVEKIEVKTESIGEIGDSIERRCVEEDDNTDEETEEPGERGIVVYSTDRGDGFISGDEAQEENVEVVHALMAAPKHQLAKDKGVPSNLKWQTQNLSLRHKSKRGARKSTGRRDISGGPSLKKKPVPVSSGLILRDENSGPRDEDRKLKEIDVGLPPFGPKTSGHSDIRNKVRETLRLFHSICRKMLQGEEAKTKPEEEEVGKSDKSKKPKRIDLRAAEIIKDRKMEVNTEKQVLGEVHGVEVGDEFQYRVELAIVGVHRLYQAGIDSMKHNGTPVATSIVSAGVYLDDTEDADVLKYSGEGGNVVGKNKKPEDQKLVRGNLALWNSIAAKTPVRVIRGWKTKPFDAFDSKSSRSRLVTTYVYDGLYTVTDCKEERGPHGKMVYMFELRRNPGQPELAWKELKRLSKHTARPGICVKDISLGKEPYPICAVNTLDDIKPPQFNYIHKMKYPTWHHPVAPEGCDCSGRCADSKRCKCVVKNGGEIPYNRNGAIVEAKTLVYECGPNCKCPPSCYNRVSQRGIKFTLEIFKTESRGWGVRSLNSIPSGSFICEYAGELLEDKEAEQKIGNDEYLFDIGQNYADSSTLKSDEPIEVLQEGGYTIDACQYGNIGRFINHSCSPNLYAQNVIYDHDDKRMPHVMFFAAETIPPLHELTYHYNYTIDQVRDSDGNIKIKKCYCGTAECTGRMY